jgi:type VI secretion system protein ImpE
MLAEQSLRDGDLNAALLQLQDAVRSNPARADYRVFLFQLLSVLGQWDRALNQLNVAGELDVKALAMVQTYREVLQCEALRSDVFSGDRTPLMFGEPESWFAEVINALSLGSQGHVKHAQDVRFRAFDKAPVVSGTLDGESFEWISDADSRIGPFLEAVVNGKYYWLPFHRIKVVRVEEPVDLRDLVWLPAQFIWANGGEAVGFISTRYPGSENSEESAIRLSRATHWQGLGEEQYAGLGQRLLVTDQAEYPLLNIREILINCPIDRPTNEAT